MKISKKNSAAFVRNHAYGEEIIHGGGKVETIDCKTLLAIKYGIITESFLVYI